MPPERKGDILVFDYPSAGRTLVLDVTCVGPYTSTHGLNHTPDGLPIYAARIAEGIKKEDSYAALDKTSHAFLPLALDVFCGTAPRADEFLRRSASIVVTRGGPCIPRDPTSPPTMPSFFTSGGPGSR